MTKYSSNLLSPNIIKNSLKEGVNAFYETFDRETSLNRPGMSGIKTAVNTFDLFARLVEYNKEE
jgi:hypothetical protein